MYVPYYKPRTPQQAILFKQILSKTTELEYVERSVFMKEMIIQTLWTFELWTQEGINVPIWIIVCFQQRDIQNSQNLNKDTFYRPSVTNAQCMIWTEKSLDSVILLKYDDADYSQGYGQIKEAFRAVTKDDILQPSISDHDFRSSNEANNIDYNLFFFDLRFQKTLEPALPIKVEFIFSENIHAGIYGCALVLTTNFVSVSSDGEKSFSFNLGFRLS